MDAVLLSMMRSGGRNKGWAETMINLEARKLIDIANTLSVVHLNDGLTRMKFVQEISEVVERQFAVARQAKTDEECMACLKNLREEAENLQEQGRMLRIKSAKLYAQVEFVRENNKIVGYVISAVKIVVSGVAIIGGSIMMATMPAIGTLAGAILVMDGINGVTKEIINLGNDKNKSEGFLADGSVELAKFMGFKAEAGLAIYNSISLAASVYSIVGLSKRPEAWRLFRYISGDFYRKVTTISNQKLTMRIIGYGIKAKVIFDLLSINSDNF